MQQWNVDLYESKHQFVSQLSSDLVAVLDPKPREYILDLGCGTGHLTQNIADFGSNVLGLDQSAAMIEHAQKSYPHLSFICQDATNFNYSEQFEGIFSNAVLHWILTPERVIERIWRALKPGGRFVAEFGGKRNVYWIQKGLEVMLVKHGYSTLDLHNLWYFPSIAEYTHLLEKQGLDVTYALLWERPTPLVGKDGLRDWIRMFAGSILDKVPLESQNSFLDQIEEFLEPHLHQNHIWYADYRRLRVVAWKPKSPENFLPPNYDKE